MTRRFESLVDSNSAQILFFVFNELVLEAISNEQ